MLVDSPCKFVVQFPCHANHQDRSEGDNARNGDEYWLGLVPEINVQDICQDAYGFLDLFNLHCTVDQQSNIADADSNDLNGVFEAQSVVDKH